MGLKDFLFNNDYSFLLQIAIILLSTKLLGLLTKRISLPQVVGALAAGIILGPMLLDVVERNDLIVSLAELGVIVLMFSAGLETDIQELKKAGLASFVIALLGVIVPLVGGFFLADFFPVLAEHFHRRCPDCNFRQHHRRNSEGTGCPELPCRQCHSGCCRNR